MAAIRHLLAQRHLAILICTAALLLKLLVPTGYMLANDGGRIAITVCSGMVAEPMATGMPGMSQGKPDHGGKDHGKAEQPCAFSGFSAASLGAVDAVQLAALIAFIVAVAIFSAPLPPAWRHPRLRPPLRGPPARL